MNRVSNVHWGYAELEIVSELTQKSAKIIPSRYMYLDIHYQNYYSRY